MVDRYSEFLQISCIKQHFHIKTLPEAHFFISNTYIIEMLLYSNEINIKMFYKKKIHLKLIIQFLDYSGEEVIIILLLPAVNI